MIDITFPSDPSDLIFELRPKFASVYLLARAIRHYGADNVNAISCHFRTKQEYEAAVARGYTLDELATGLGLVNFKYVWFDQLSTERLYNDRGQPRVELLKLTSPALQKFGLHLPIDEGYTTSFQFSAGSLSTLACLAIVAGRIDHKLTLNTDNNSHKTLARWEARSSTPQHQTALTKMRESHDAWWETVGKTDPLAKKVLWYPLYAYTPVDIIIAAEKEGLLDLIQRVNTCDYKRSIPCGDCSGCLKRRMSFIEADIKDTMKYATS